MEALNPYKDGKGWVTIGVGYNLADANVRGRVLEAMKITDSLKINNLNAYLIKPHNDLSNDQIQKDLNDRLGSTFKFTSIAQVKLVFNGLCRTDGLAQTYEDKVDAFASKYSLGTIPDSKERIALLSLAWNTKDGSKSLLGKGLGTAMAQGNRAEAWYEIRYNSNGDISRGTAKRRFYEAEVFSLYDSGDQAKDKEEALQVYRMFTAHRDKILKYENTYGNLYDKVGSDGGDQVAKANSDYVLYPNPSGDFVKTLVAELDSSAKNLMQEYIKDEYSRARDFNYLNIQVANKPTRPNTPSTIGEGWAILNGEDTADRTGSADDLLIADGDFMAQLYGNAGDDVLILGNAKPGMLYGGIGNDILVGGDQVDYLDGGEGAHTLIGGKVQDTLIGGSGNDIFIVEGDDTAYDTFTGGEGIDTIRGSANDDTIRVHDFSGENTVEVIDGVGGAHDTIAGTDDAETIDLSGTILKNISSISGGNGADTITGGAGDDHIYGDGRHPRRRRRLRHVKIKI